jgi:tetratricopeptide (TPR) repeat protein
LNRRIVIIGIVIIALLIVAHGLLLNGIRQQRLEREAMATQLAPVQQAMEEEKEEVPILITRQAEYEAKQAALDAINLSFPSETDTTRVLALVVLQADTHNVRLPRISARPATTLTMGGVNYRVLGYDVTAQGALNAVSGFVRALETGPISSTALSQISVAAQPTPTPGGAIPAYRSEITLKIYTRPLAPGAEPPAGDEPLISTDELIQELQTRITEAQQAGSWDRAISLLLVLRQLKPDDETLDDQLIEAYVNAGQQQLNNGEYPRAAQSFRAALALDPDNAAAQTGLTQLQLLTPTTTPTVTSTPSPSPTPSPSLTPTPSATPMPYYVTRLERSANTRYEDLGCDWFGFYGKITDVNGYPVSGINVHIWAQDWVGLTTTTSNSGEYEIYLDDHPKAETWFIQLFAGGEAISEAIVVESYADCGSALIRMDWRRGY